LPDERHQLEDLVRGRDADGIGEADALRMEPIDGAVDAQQVVGVGAEGVLAAEADFQPLTPG